MSFFQSTTTPLGWPKALLFIAAAVICFHAAYWPGDGPLHLAIIGYVICLTQLARLSTTRRAYYAGLVTGLLCVAPQLTCFWKIFGPAAIGLWYVLAFWIAAFTATTRAALTRFGPVWTALLIPFLWMGFEYFRSELYYLKFSWMNVGYAFSGWDIFPFHIFGIYGVGFLVAICGAAFLLFRPLYAAFASGTLIVFGAFLQPALAGNYRTSQVHIAGVQLEFPGEQQIPPALDSLVAKYPSADILVLSEYTFNGPIPVSLKDWCRNHRRYVIVGGTDPAPNNNFYDSAFVVGPDGEILFRQGKSVPIQFFKDGLPAPKQDVWDSPWGKIGFCVCYDLSYTRVIDGLINKGAQLLIVPTMDVADWGERQHQLHALVAPVRAAEYHIPIFRLASSGISQAVAADSSVRATAPFGGEGKDLFATLHFSPRTSLPLDRFLARIAVATTGIVVLILCVGHWRKKPAPLTPPGEREIKPEAATAP
jgi:apolipoprotein N-acyltransferase